MLERVKLEALETIPVVHMFQALNLGSKDPLNTFHGSNLANSMWGPDWAAILDIESDVCLEEEEHSISVSSSEGS